MKRALGKGMMALMDENYLNDEAEKSNLTISLLNIVPNRYQPRKTFNEDSLKDLAQSIKEKGVITPIIVTDLGDGRYELVAGERRFRASKLAGLSEIPAIIKDFSEEDRIEIALIENIQREDLNSLEIAQAYNEIMERLHITQETLSQRIGKSRSSIANTVRLLKLPDFIKNLILSNELTEGHARAILSLEEPQKMIEFAQLIVNKKLTVREAEEFAKDYQTDNVSHETKEEKITKITKNSPLSHLEETLIQKLGYKIKINGNNSKGKIQIFYNNKSELETLYQILSNK